MNTVTNMGFHKIQKLSWLAEELLTFSKGLRSMELVMTSIYIEGRTQAEGV